MEWIDAKEESPLGELNILFLDKFNNFCVGSAHIYKVTGFCVAFDLISKESREVHFWMPQPKGIDDLVRNKFCRKCGEPLKRKRSCEYKSTLVGYGKYDDNCVTTPCTCKNGHTAIISIQNTHIDGWKGKDECFCCLKVDEWPEEEDL